MKHPALALGAALFGFLGLHSHSLAAAEPTHEPAASPAGGASPGDNVVAILALDPDKNSLMPPDLSIQVDSELSSQQFQYIRSLVRDKKFDRAMSELDAFERNLPRSATVHTLRATVYLAQNDVANARKSFERAFAIRPNSVAIALNLAQLDLHQKDPEAARQRLQRILTSQPDNVDAMIGMAAVAASTNQTAENLKWLEKAVQAAPKAIGPRVLLAKRYLDARQVPKALSVAREAQVLSPDDPQVLQVLGLAQLAAGENDNAVSTFSKLTRVAPDDPVAHYRLAVAQWGIQAATPARNSLRRAVALKPNFTEAKALLAAVEIGSRRYDEALRLAREVEKEQSNAPSGWILEGDALMGLKQYPNARRAYERGFEVQRTGPLAMKLHSALVLTGNEAEADSRMQRWLKEQPSDVRARMYLANHYMRSGKSGQAAEQFELVLQNDRDNYVALNNLATLYNRQQDPRALQLAERAFKLKPNDPAIADTLGWVLFERGDRQRGLELLRQAADAAPRAPDVQYHYAAALAKAGESSRARRELDRMIARDKSFGRRPDVEALLKQLSSN